MQLATTKILKLLLSICTYVMIQIFQLGAGIYSTDIVICVERFCKGWKYYLELMHLDILLNHYIYRGEGVFLTVFAMDHLFSCIETHIVVHAAYSEPPFTKR